MAVGVLDPVAPVPPESPPAPKRRWGRTLIALLAVCATVASASWWFRGGARLQPAAFGVTTTARPGEWAHVGIALGVSGGHVTLVSARALHQSGAAQIQFEVLHAGPGDTGLLSIATGGTLTSLGYRSERVHGADVRAPDPRDPQVDLVLSMHSDGPGVARVGGVEITYRSGPRTLHAHADVSVCVGVGATAAQQGGCAG